MKQLPPPLPQTAAQGAAPAPRPAATTRAAARLAPAALSPVKSPQQLFATQQKATATLTAARSSADQGVTDLQQARAGHHHLANTRVDGRLLDLICKELVIEFTSEGSNQRVANQDLPLPPPTPTAPGPSAAGALKPDGPREPSKAEGSLRAAQAVELIEKIETFVRDARRPCLALTLNNSLGAKVEIERVGPREVALKVFGHRGPPRADDIGRIRDELAAHGLKVCALSVA